MAARQFQVKGKISQEFQRKIVLNTPGGETVSKIWLRWMTSRNRKNTGKYYIILLKGELKG